MFVIYKNIKGNEKMKTKLEVIRINEDVIATSASNDCDKVYGFLEFGEGCVIYYNNSSNEVIIDFNDQVFNKYEDYYDSSKFFHINDEGDIIGVCEHSGDYDEAAKAHNHQHD